MMETVSTFGLRKWFAGIALAGIAVLGTYYAVGYERSRGRQALAAINNAALPAGTEQAWHAYIDRRLAATLHRKGSALNVRADIDGFLGNSTDVPLATPFAVDCTRGFGAIVRFENGGDALTASIFGPTVVEPPAEHPPALGVSPGSIAASDLKTALCTRIAAGVRDMMAR